MENKGIVTITFFYTSNQFISNLWLCTLEKSTNFWGPDITSCLWSDFWGCLKPPRNNPIENLHMQFCRQILGVQKNTTNNGVLLEIGRTPLMLEAQRLSVKNWERIKNGDGNSLVTYSYQNACNKELDWIRTIHTLLARNGYTEYPTALLTFAMRCWEKLKTFSTRKRSHR